MKISSRTPMKVKYVTVGMTAEKGKRTCEKVK